ncbi:MAG: gamma-glutamylcyclotransferase family protein [Oscillospiraceae bacterium]
MTRIFSYGTFRSPYVQRRLFGHEIPAEDAVLEGYAVFAGADGYHGLLPCPHAAVTGSILNLNDREMEIADGWEICPQMYIRREMPVSIDGTPERAWVYFRADSFKPGKRIEDNGLLCTLPQEQLERELDEYTEELKMKGLS